MPDPTFTPFSQELSTWLKSRKPKTINGLTEVTAEKSFAVIFLVMMAVSALPLPTGGVTALLEIITIILALQLVAGRSSIWLPQRLLHRKLGKTMEKHSLPYLIKKIRWLEKYSKPRMGHLIGHRESLRVVGLIVIIFTLGSFVAPSFSGLDTLPALGVVVLSLGLLLDDIAVLIVGVIIGTVGVILEIALAATIIEGFKQLYSIIYS